MFMNDSELREQIQLELLKLNNTDVYYITTLLQEDLLKRPNWLKYLKLDLILIALLIPLTFKFRYCLINL